MGSQRTIPAILSGANFRIHTVTAEPREWPKKIAFVGSGRLPLFGVGGTWRSMIVLTWDAVSWGVGNWVGRGRRIEMYFMSRTMICRSGARMARFVMNQIRDRTEPIPWNMTRGGRGDAGDTGL